LKVNSASCWFLFTNGTNLTGEIRNVVCYMPHK